MERPKVTERKSSDDLLDEAQHLLEELRTDGCAPDDARVSTVIDQLAEARSEIEANDMEYRYIQSRFLADICNQLTRALTHLRYPGTIRRARREIKAVEERLIVKIERGEDWPDTPDDEG